MGPMSDEIEFQLGNDASPKKRPAVPDSVLDKEPTLLEELIEEIAKKVEKPEIEIALPARPSVSLSFSPNITQYELRQWRRKSTEKKSGELDSLKFACQIVGHTCTGIYIHGEQVFDEDGNAITFGSPAVMKMTNTAVPIPDAIQAFFGIDPHIESAALAILEAAGYGEELTQEENPTKTILGS